MVGGQALFSLEKRLLTQYVRVQKSQKGQGCMRLTPHSVLLIWSLCLTLVQTNRSVTAWEVKENTLQHKLLICCFPLCNHTTFYTSSCIENTVQVLSHSSSISSSRSSVKKLNPTGPSTEPLGALGTICQLHGCSSIHHCSLDLAVQAVCDPAKTAPVPDMGCQLLQETGMGNSIKGFAEVQLGNIYRVFLIWCDQT